jgi:DNA-binding NarL/FixJ family response regulator
MADDKTVRPLSPSHGSDRPQPAAEASPARALIVEGHPMEREVLRDACERRAALSVVGAVATPAEAMQICLRHPPDVLILNLPMPAAEAMDVVLGFRNACPELPILVVSPRRDDLLLFKCIRAGARGYVEKTASGDEIAEAVERVAAGQEVLSANHRTAAQRQAIDHATRARDGVRIAAALTPREKEVLTLAVHGLSARQVGERLGMSERTAETHLGRVYRKLGVRNRLQALHRAASIGLVELGDTEG